MHGKPNATRGQQLAGESVAMGRSETLSDHSATTREEPVLTRKGKGGAKRHSAEDNADREACFPVKTDTAETKPANAAIRHVAFWQQG
jgi:hypothetical protein